MFSYIPTAFKSGKELVPLQEVSMSVCVCESMCVYVYIYMLCV